jgi:hypothetical protein
LPNVFPLLLIDNKTKKFKVIIEKEISTKTYTKRTKEIIQLNKINPDSALYWTDGIKMFNNQGLIKLLVSNHSFILKSKGRQDCLASILNGGNTIL